MFDSFNPLTADDTRLRLTDGTTCHMRPSGPGDRDLLTRCFAALSPRARRLRFFAEKRLLTDAELDHFVDVDGHQHIAFVAVRTDAAGNDQEPLGFARCLRLTPGGETAELSITVIDQAQGQGVGSALVARLARAAHTQGIRRFWFETAADNEGMRRLARRLGGVARWVGDGILEYDCPLPAPAPAAPAPARPWALGPDAWITPLFGTWEASLYDWLRAVDAANEDLVQWFEWDALDEAA
jgi:RimJ/RimL family protein N-acetyltransferase